MPNDNFSLRRIALYARKHYAENGRYYLCIGAAILTLLLVPLFILHDGSDLYYSGAFVVGVVAGASWLHRTCRSFYKPVEAAQAYTLPLTQVEKYLFCWVNSFLVYGLVFVLALSVAVVVSHIPGLDFLRLTHPFEWFGWTVLCICTVLHAAALFCCSWAVKSPLKGYLLLGGIAFVLMMVYGRLMVLLTGQMLVFPLPAAPVICLSESTDTLLIYLIDAFVHAQGVRYAVSVAAALLFWTAGYYKFRERTLK